MAHLPRLKASWALHCPLRSTLFSLASCSSVVWAPLSAATLSSTLFRLSHTWQDFPPRHPCSSFSLPRLPFPVSPHVQILCIPEGTCHLQSHLIYKALTLLLSNKVHLFTHTRPLLFAFHGSHHSVPFIEVSLLLSCGSLMGKGLGLIRDGIIQISNSANIYSNSKTYLLLFTSFIKSQLQQGYDSATDSGTKDPLFLNCLPPWPKLVVSPTSPP